MNAIKKAALRLVGAEEPSAFEQLLETGAKHERELRRLNSSDGRLSAEGLYAAYLAEPFASEAEVGIAEKAMDDPVWQPLLPRALAQIVRSILTFSATSPLKEPYLSRQHLDEHELDALRRLGVSPASFAALACKKAAQKQPDHFGKLASMTEHAARITETTRLCDRAAEQLEATWSRDDLIVDLEAHVTHHLSEADGKLEVRPRVHSYITFRAAPTVALGNGLDLGRRLIAAKADEIAAEQA